MEATYPVQLNGLDPLLSVFGVLGSQVPHAVVYTYVQPALVKLVGLQRGREECELSVRVSPQHFPRGNGKFYYLAGPVGCQDQQTAKVILVN